VKPTSETGIVFYRILGSVFQSLKPTAVKPGSKPGSTSAPTFKTKVLPPVYLILVSVTETKRGQAGVKPGVQPSAPTHLGGEPAQLGEREVALSVQREPRASGAGCS